MDLDKLWRSRIANRCGGEQFDAPGGGYAFSAVLAEERQLAQANKPGDPSSALLTLSVADPTWKMPGGAMEALMGYYRDCDDATRYTDNAGIRAGNGTTLGDTHEEIAAFLHARYPGLTVDLTPDWLQYSPGAIKRALAEYIPTLLFESGLTNLIFPTPGYPVIKSPKNARGIIINDIPLILCGSRWLINWILLNDWFVRGEFDLFKKVIVYVNIPHNPTGSAYTLEDWQPLIDWATKSGGFLIVDEAYTDLRYVGNSVSVLTVPGWEECCIVLQSVSKGWNATGLRFGWMIAHPTVIKALRQVTDVKDSGLFGPTIAAGLACLRHLKWVEPTQKRYQQLHRLLADGLRQAGFAASMPEAGLCQFTPAPKAADGQEFADVVACAKWFREKLRISLMHYTMADNPWLRWAVTLKPVPECGLPDESSVIREAVRRLQQVKFYF